MSINLKPEVSVLRVYSDDRSYENKDAYDAIMTVHHLGDKEVYLSGLHGTINRHILEQIFAQLKENGIETVRFERHGKDIVRKI